MAAGGCWQGAFSAFASRMNSHGTPARGTDASDTPESAALQQRWALFQQWTLHRFGKAADIEGILFLVGIQELGQGFAPDLEKNRKEQILLEGTYCVLETLGYYERIGMEGGGHWIWEQSHPLPQDLSKEAEERLLRTAVLRYFDTHYRNWTDES